MDKEAYELVQCLRPFVGISASFIVLRTMKELDLKPPIVLLSSAQKKLLADNLADNILNQFMSSRKVMVHRSHFYSILGVRHYVEHSQTGDRVIWN